MIVVSGLAKHYGPKTLFEGVQLQLNPGHRYGLVGANGSGKTTFLKILAGDEAADAGSISFGKQLRLGVLRQDQFAADDERILSVAMRGDAEVFAALEELDALARGEAPAAGGAEELAERMASLNEVLARLDGYTLESRARETLVGLGIPAEALEQPLRTLSGGFKLRVLLAQVLVGRPDVLLLDEPTNHLDILSIRWLERFLQGYAGCALVISHDRRFLDAVSTRTLDVDYETITEYAGNYTQFLVEKASTRERKEAEIARAERQIAQKRAFVERFGAKATKARQAQSRLKQIEKIEVAELAQSSRRAPNFSFQQERPSGKDVLAVEAVSKAYGDKRVLEGVGFQVRRGERVAIIGANGIGKSTLLKILVGRLQPDSGSYEWGINTKVSYFAQDHHELLSDPKTTPLEYVWEICPMEPTTYVRGQLGRMLFSGSEVDKPVSTLSGGEAARVVFARIAVERPNVLILDEPTNHLDLETIDALAEALQSYEGTLLFVSHDRHFVGRLATRIIDLRADGLHDFPGTYEDYLARDGDDHLDVEAVVLKAKREAQASKGREDGQLSWEERKRRENRRKALPKQRDRLLAEIDAAEKEKAEIDARFAEPGFFERTSPEEVAALQRRQEELDAIAERTMAEWEAVETELAEFEAEA
ncbi:MAG: ABC-F family ATP-binding cassette domain-containing protein [Myxococcales bacterium]|jgi:ATPase subunit of ABC transporter with duplicated ATPase domains|nr:ABC-F family ATP-binding cassette domain-containing protein [Myxococcales bacterium]